MAKKKQLEPVEEIDEIFESIDESIEGFEDEDESDDDEIPESFSIITSHEEPPVNDYPTETHLYCRVKANTDPTVKEKVGIFNNTLILREKINEEK